MDELFNSTYPIETTSGFKAKPGYNGKTYNLEYSSTNNTYLRFENGSLNVIGVTNETNNVFISIDCDGVTRYLPVKIVANDFDFNLSGGSTSEAKDQVYLRNLISYKYKDEDGEDETINNADYISISGISCNNRTYSLQTVENGYEIGFNKEGDWVAVVTFNKDPANGWIISRNSNFAYTKLTIHFSVTVKTSNEQLQLTINFTNDISVNLNDNYSNFYANTQILFAEKATTEDGFVNNPMFKILDKSTVTDTQYKAEYTHGGQSNSITNIYSPFTLQEGEYYFRFSKANTGGDDFLIEFRVVVAANIVVSQTSEQQKAANSLISGKQYDISHILTLQSYKSDVVFGQKSGNEIQTYESENVLTDFNDYANLNFDEGSLALDYNSGSQNFTTKNIEEIYGTISKTITLSYGNHSSLIDVKISNKYTAEVDNQNLEIRANIWYDCPIKISAISGEDIEGESWQLSSVKMENEELSFEVADNKFKLTGEITKDYENVNLIFEFNYLGNKLIFKTNNDLQKIKVTLKPHVPPLKESYVAYSNSKFDLINDVFNLEGDESVQEMKIQAITAGDENAFTDTSFVNSRGYIKGSPQNTGCEITFNDIVGETRTISITYLIAYSQNASYSYNFNLVITNCQSMQVNYPGEHIHQPFAAVNFQMVNDASEQEQQYFIAEQAKQQFNFEPVITGQKITFAYDENLHVNRVEIANRNEQDRVAGISEVKLIAYDSRISVLNLSKIYQINDKSITFINGATFTSIYLVFKITSNSGNFVYYYVNLTNTSYVQNGNFKNVDSTSCWNLGAIESSTTPAFYENNKILGEELTNDILVSTFHVSNVANLQRQNLSLYLLDATMLDGSNFFIAYGIKRFSQPSGNLSALNNFCTLTFGLVYWFNGNEGAALLGTIVAEIQPSVMVETSLQNYNNNVSNGVYLLESKNLNLNQNFSNPFTVGGSLSNVEIVDVGNQPFSTDGESVSYSGTTLLKISNNNLLLTKYVAETTDIFIKYTFKIEQDNFVLLLCLKLNTPNIQSSADNVAIGTFDTQLKSFTQDYVLNSEETSIVPNSYKGTIEIEIDGNEHHSISLSSNSSLEFENIGSCSVEDGQLKLNFILNGNDYNFKIIYLDIVPQKEISFKVTTTNGIYYHYDSSSTTNGQYQGMACPTTKTNNYKSEVGSTLQIVKDQNHYNLGGLDIYLSQPASLVITPNNENDREFIKTNMSNITSTTTLEFYHLANNINIPLTIDVLVGGKSILDSQLTFWLRLEKTYNGITPVYPLKNAQYENVASQTTINNIRQNLFEEAVSAASVTDLADTTTNLYNPRRVAIKGLSDELIFDYDIGFSNSLNPNYMYIDESGEVNKVDENKLAFEEMTNANTSVNIKLSNRAGVNSVEYYYQIIGTYDKIGGGTDGLRNLNGNQASLQNLTCNITVSDDAWDNPFSTTNTIANLIDTNNNQIYLTNISARLSSKDVAYTSINKSTVNGSITYTIEFGDFNITLTRNANNELVLNFSRQTSQAFKGYKNLTLTLTLYGESGLMANLTINIYNG